MQYDTSLLKENLNDKVSYKDFFHALGYKDKDTIYFRTINDKDKEKDARKKEVTLSRISGILPTLKKENADNWGVFYVVNGDGQKDDQVRSARACFIDGDELPLEEQLKLLCDFPLEPSIIIKTKKSLHAYWITPDGEKKYFKELQERLITHFKSDPVIKNESRVMRLYGFNHCKLDPVEVKLIKFSPELTYTQRQLHEVLPKLKKTTKKSSSKQKAPTEIIPYHQRHGYVVKRVGFFVSKLGRYETDEAILDYVVSDFLKNCAQDPPVNMDKFKKKYLKTIQKFMAGLNSEGEDVYKKAGKWWNRTHPGCKIENWDDVIAEYLTYSELHPEEEANEQRIEEGYQKQKVADAEKGLNLALFHHFNKQNQPTSVYDFKIYEDISKSGELFFLGGVPYHYDHGVYVADVGGTHLKTEISRRIYPEFIKSTTIDRIYRLFLCQNELQATTDDINRYPKRWINFRNGFYDPIEMRMIHHDPKYRAINQIPHDYYPEAKPEGAEVESWLKFIVPSPDDREMLLQYIGYSMTSDTRFQKMLILLGQGGSGKSTLISMMENIIGAENVSHISLKELSHRFFSYGLVGKLLNSCADLEVSALEDTSVIKKLLGEDGMMVEAKGKDIVSYKNYAKLVFSTNELPLVLSEKTNGFYRRLLILNMNNRPEKSKADYLDILSKGTDYLIRLSVEALKRAYQQERITESEESAKSVQALWNDSDSVEAWLNECCKRNKDSRTERIKLFVNYDIYCNSTDRKPLTKNGFYKALRVKGFRETRSNGKDFFEGIFFEKSSLNGPENLHSSEKDADESELIPFEIRKIPSA